MVLPWSAKVWIARVRHVCVCCSTRDYRTSNSIWCSLCKYYGPEACPKGERCLR